MSRSETRGPNGEPSNPACGAPLDDPHAAAGGPATVAALQALGHGLAQMAGMRVVVSESEWSWNARSRVLTIASQDVVGMSLYAAAGIVAHEAGHAALSVATPAAAPGDMPERVWMHAFNALEDTRVEAWARLRWPVSGQWLDAAWAYKAADLEPGLATLPRGLALQRFLLALLVEWHTGWQADQALEQDLQMDLALTRRARQELVTLLPPLAPGASAPVASEVVKAFAHTVWLVQRELSPVLLRRFHAENTLLARQLQVCLPQRRAAARLVQAATLDHKRGQVDRAQLLKRGLAALALLQQLDPVVPAPEVVAHAGDMALASALLDILNLPAMAPPQHAASEAESAGTPVRAAPDQAAQAMARSQRLPERSQLLAQLRRRLDEVFPPTTSSGWMTGYASGPRLHLRTAVAATVDPRRYRDAWQRRTVRAKPDAAVLLLVDLSGSMSRHNKVAAAVLAASVSAQALRELGVPTAVVGFQDTLIPLADFDEPWSAEMERRLASMTLEAVGKRPGGHNRPSANYDGPCLAWAARLLQQQVAAQHILVVFSDGEPSGHQGQHKLQAAVAEVLAGRTTCLVGLGLGRGTTHVARYYPDARANIAVTEFPHVLTTTLVRRLRTARLAG
jgi:hypothetical protein